MQRKRLVILLGSVFLVLVLALIPFVGACAPEEVAPPEEEEEEAPPEEIKTLKLGCSLPFNSPIGIAIKKYFDVLIPKFNEAGGLVVKGQRYNIEYVIYDDKYTADAGRAAMERLVYSDKVDFIVGNVGSAPTTAALAITEIEGVLVIANCASDGFIIDKRYTVRAGASMTDDPVNFGVALKVYPEVKSVVLVPPDDDTGHWLAESAGPLWESLGVELLDVLYYPRDEVNFAPLATKIASMNPDIVDFTCGGGGATQEGLQIQALYDAGWMGVINAYMGKMDEVTAVASDEALEGAISILYATELPDPPPAAAELRNAYEEKYGDWDSTGVAYFCPWYLFIAAVEKADSLDRDDILAAMEGIEFDSAAGHYMMVKRPDLGIERFCDVIAGKYIAQVRGGEKVWIETMSLEEAVGLVEEGYGYAGQWR